MLPHTVSAAKRGFLGYSLQFHQPYYFVKWPLAMFSITSYNGVVDTAKIIFGVIYND